MFQEGGFLKKINQKRKQTNQTTQKSEEDG